MFQLEINLRCLFLCILCLQIFSNSNGNEESNTGGSLSIPENVLTEAATESVVPIPLNSPETDNGDGDNTKAQKISVAKNFEQLFTEGSKAYHDQLWYSCAEKLEKSLKKYKSYKRVVTDCRLKCLKGERVEKLSNFTISVESLSNFTYFLKTADCIRRCNKDLLGDQENVSTIYDWAFEEKKPYLYLQYCYFKLDRFKQAASATYTFYLSNPNNEDAKTNMNFYKNTLKVARSDFLDMEMVPYRDRYIRGTIAYVEQDWKSVLSLMEEALDEYYLEDERCKANCFDTGKFETSDLLTGVADQLVKVMICQMDCEKKLSVLYTEPDPHFLESIFHYLQYAHYQLEDLEKSAEAAASFLLLNPTHEIMNENRDVIQDLLKITKADFVPRESLQQYVKNRKLMIDDMDFVNKNYKWGDGSVIEDEEETELTGEQNNDDWMTRYEKLGMHLIAKDVDLHRAERFVTDGLLKDEQCSEILNLMADVPKQDNGAQVFNLKLAQQTMEKGLDEDYETSLRMLVRAVEMVRHYAQRFNKPDPGYFVKKTSVVCWNHEPDYGDMDCYPQEDGDCLRYKDMSEDFYKEMFTTVTYLTSADEDGDFSFLGDEEKVDYRLGIKCGRTVGFNSGDRHALNIPKKSDTKRCAMLITHSTFQSDDEKEYKDTITLLHHLNTLRFEKKKKNSKDVMSGFEKTGVKIVKNGEQLYGRERFVADGIASEEECMSMKDMVRSGAIFGDGYDHQFEKPSFISPHTKNELYSGITIYRASKMTHAGKFPLSTLKSFLELSEKSRLFVEHYFNLSTPLYFDYTHLVCRSAVDDTKQDREDLSHPVHADNCLLKPNGTCTKEFPAFIQRDYSAVLYVNDDFKGGEFFFAHSNKSEQVSVRPKCGRLVGFNSGAFHGVKAVTSGQRCAMALWFTLNPNFKELAHVQARKVLKDLERNPPVHDDL